MSREFGGCIPFEPMTFTYVWVSAMPNVTKLSGRKVLSVTIS